MPTVRDIMDDQLPVVRPDDTVETVVHLLRNRDIPGVAVVNEGGRCVGVVTDNDLVIADEEGDLHLPHMISLFGGVVFLEPLRRFEDRLRKAFAGRVSDMMSADPVTIDVDADVRAAARAISESRHNRLPVVEHGRYVGMVSRADVLEALATS
jgi:CBS domain-containing protein